MPEQALAEQPALKLRRIHSPLLGEKLPKLHFHLRRKSCATQLLLSIQNFNVPANYQWLPKSHFRFSLVALCLPMNSRLPDLSFIVGDEVTSRFLRRSDHASTCPAPSVCVFFLCLCVNPFPASSRPRRSSEKNRPLCVSILNLSRTSLRTCTERLLCESSSPEPFWFTGAPTWRNWQTR